MPNPLLNLSEIQFSNIESKHICPAVTLKINDYKIALDVILSSEIKPTFELLLNQVEYYEEEVNKILWVVEFLNVINRKEEFNNEYLKAKNEFDEFKRELNASKNFYDALKYINENEGDCLDYEQKAVIELRLREFKLNGFDLLSENKERLKDIITRLSFLANKFEHNYIKAISEYRLYIENIGDVTGLPQSVLQLAKEKANKEGKDGLYLTMDDGCYAAVMRNCDNRKIREQIYKDSMSICSEIGPLADIYDNGPIMVEIINLRQELAKLLGFANYVELSMVKRSTTTDKIDLFIKNIIEKSKNKAEQENIRVREFAKKYGVDKLEHWDESYYLNKIEVDEEPFEEYFQIDNVLKGLFDVVGKVFGLYFKITDVPFSWDENAKLLKVYDEKDEFFGEIYLDLYARKNKKGGARRKFCMSRSEMLDGIIQTPSCFLITNFNPPTKDIPSLLSHDNVVLLFHEFGHCLHEILARTRYPSVGGTKRLSLDSLEMPSQFLENYAWQKECIEQMSCHYLTKEKLTNEQVDKLLTTKYTGSGNFVLGQMYLALFDLELHKISEKISIDDINSLSKNVYEATSLSIFPEYNRRPYTFTHIFESGYGSGYQAGYFAYDWSLAVASDVFGEFEKNGIFEKDICLRFKKILEAGASKKFDELVYDFLKRDINFDIMLENLGVIEKKVDKIPLIFRNSKVKDDENNFVNEESSDLKNIVKMKIL